MKPVNPTFFLQLRHLFFFFFPSLFPSGVSGSLEVEGPSTSAGVEAAAPPPSEHSDSVLLSVWIEDGTITVGEAVSTEVADDLTDGLVAVVDEVSSMERDAMVAWAGGLPAMLPAMVGAMVAACMLGGVMRGSEGASECGIPCGGCCFFLIMSL